MISDILCGHEHKQVGTNQLFRKIRLVKKSCLAVVSTITITITIQEMLSMYVP